MQSSSDQSHLSSLFFVTSNSQCLQNFAKKLTLCEDTNTKFGLILPIVCIFFIACASSAYGADVVINEFLANPTSPGKEWVEIYNPSHIDVKDYFIDDDESFSDDVGSGSKKSLSGSQNSSSEFVVLEFSSFLNNSGDNVVLFDQNGTILDKYNYSGDPGKDITIGRSPDGNGSFTTLADATKGSPNAKEATPTLTETPTPSKTPSPTKLPTPTKTPTPTRIPTVTKTPTSIVHSYPSPTSTPTPNRGENILVRNVTSLPNMTPSSSSSEVLGESAIALTPVKKEESEERKLDDSEKKRDFFQFVLPTIGAGFISGGVFFYIRNKRLSQD